MKPTLKMIKALRKAAEMVKDDDYYYKWDDLARCNCGTLLMALDPTKSAMQIGYIIRDVWINSLAGHEQDSCAIGGGWSPLGEVVKVIKSKPKKEICQVTGLEVFDVITELEKYGFEFDKGDFELIEFAGLTRSAFTGSDNRFEYRSYVSKFFLRLANKLEKQRDKILKERRTIKERRTTAVSHVFESNEEEQHQHVTTR